MADPVEEVGAADVLLLRAAVLRPGLPLEESMYPQDDWPEARHLAVRLSGAQIVGCATFFPDPWEGDAPPVDGPAWRLRGMATAPEVRGTGSGRPPARAWSRVGRRSGCGAAVVQRAYGRPRLLSPVRLAGGADEFDSRAVSARTTRSSQAVAGLAPNHLGAIVTGRSNKREHHGALRLRHVRELPEPLQHFFEVMGAGGPQVHGVRPRRLPCRRRPLGHLRTAAASSAKYELPCNKARRRTPRCSSRRPPGR